MQKISTGKQTEIEGGSNPVRIVNTPKFGPNHVSNALFEIITVLFPRELILSRIFGRSGFGNQSGEPESSLRRILMSST
jgi:hypothetical protein